MKGVVVKEYRCLPHFRSVIAKHEKRDEEGAQDDGDPDPIRTRTFDHKCRHIANERGYVEDEETQNIVVIDGHGKRRLSRDRDGSLMIW